MNAPIRLRGQFLQGIQRTRKPRRNNFYLIDLDCPRVVNLRLYQFHSGRVPNKPCAE